MLSGQSLNIKIHFLFPIKRLEKIKEKLSIYIQSIFDVSMIQLSKKRTFSVMQKLPALWLNLLLQVTLLVSLINSAIIFQQKSTPFTLLYNEKYILNPKNTVTSSKSKLDQTTNNKVNSLPVLLTNSNQQNQLAKYSDNQKFEIFVSKESQNLNSNLIQRSQLTNLQKFNDQEQTVYTNALSLMASLGIQSNSKIMGYVKSKIESNRKMIFEHNNCRTHPFQLAQNKFIIYNPQQFKEMFLTLQEPQDKNYTRNQPSEITVTLPQKNIRKLEQVSINWKTAKKMTSVKYQKQCGACYSFTSIGAIQSAFLIKGQNLNLAEQQIIDCSTPYDNYGCIGGWTINAYQYIKNFGVLFESDYPYVAQLGNCTIPQNRPKYWIKNYVQLSNDCSVVVEALKNQPLSIAINADGWQYYSTGVYTDCKLGASNHGVVLAGVDSSNWLIKNSWGFTWGEQGYIRISRTAANSACNVCRWASYPVI